MVERSPNDDWAQAWRDLARERDGRLENVPAIPPRRRAALRAALAGAFPLEAALREATTQRDQRLNGTVPAMPRAAARELRRCLTNCHPSPSRSVLNWAVAACFVIGPGLLFLAKRETVSTHLREVSQSERSLPSFTLRLSAAELASRRSNFLAANPLSEPEEGARLRLDLPIQNLLGKSAVANTP